MDHSGILALIQQLPDAERAQIGLAILEYTLNGTTNQQLSPALSLAFEMIKGLLTPKDNRGGARPGAGRPQIKKNQTEIKKNQKYSKNSKSTFDFFDFQNPRNPAEIQDSMYIQTPENDGSDANFIPPTPPYSLSTINNCNSGNISNNINISTTRARENSNIQSAKNQPATEKTADLFSAAAAQPEKQPTKSKFTPPTVEMVAEYCRQRNNGIDARHFVDHYTVRNWIPKGSTRQMSDWRAAVRTWERTGFNRKIPPDRAATAPPDNPFAILDKNRGK